MVHRILSQPNSRVKYFGRAFGVYLMLLVLVSLAAQYLISDELSWDFVGFLCVDVPLAAFCAWLSLRQWNRLDWFTPTPHERFLTLVEEGLLIEVPAKGVSLYTPWVGLRFQLRGGILSIFSGGTPRATLGVNGVPQAKLDALLADLKRFAGEPLDSRSPFRPTQAAAPFAPVSALPQPPPLPALPLPPPRPVEAGHEAGFANTQAQWVEYVRYLMRPDWLLCTVIMLGVAALSFVVGHEVATEDCHYVLMAIFLYCCYQGIARLSRPGRTKLPRISGGLRYQLTRNEVVELLENGSWSRSRLPSAEEAELVRLPHAWCLRTKKAMGGFAFDAEAELPPELAAYRRVPAPSNRLRVVLALLLLALGLATGFGFTRYTESRLSEAELAFASLPVQPDAATLCHYLTTHFDYGDIYGSPGLIRVGCDEDEAEAFCVLFFTSGKPGEGEDDGRFHLAWENALYFDADGRLEERHSRPATWCPCDAWLNGPPDFSDEP